MENADKLENPSPSFQTLCSPQSEPQEKSSKIRGLNSNSKSIVLRRSQRIKNVVVHASNQDIEPVYEDLTLVSDYESDEPLTEVDKDTPLPQPEANSIEQSMDRKVDCLVQRFQALEKIIESLQSKVHENIGLNEALSSPSFSYRRMYIDWQKKIEALTNENRQLTGKLQHALGKVEVFEKTSQVFVQALDKMKDVILISTLARTTEVALGASASGAKRTKHTDGATERKKRRG